LYGQKTGTLTENKMSLNPYTLLAATNYKKRAMEYGRAKKVIEIAMWASEPVPFDPMEKRYTRVSKQQHDTRRQFSMIHEYPLDGNRP
jgi:Ca2+-transporting ATPase